MKKGIAPLLIILGIMLVIVGVFGIAIQFAFQEDIQKEIEAPEQIILTAINEVENAKMLSKDIFTFGSYQGVYELGKNGGQVYTEGKTYWIKLDEKKIPDEITFQGNLSELIQTRINETISLTSPYKVGKVKVELSSFAVNTQKEDDGIQVSGTLIEPIQSFDSIVNVKGSIMPSVKVETKLYKLYDEGKSIAEELKYQIAGKTTEQDVSNALTTFQNKKNSELSEDKIELQLQLMSFDGKVAEIFVKITDKNKMFPVFDKENNQNKYDYISLEFLVSYKI